MREPLLSVCLITYNHVNYIKEAIDGVLMQKVNFYWELIIADDYSTDGTREILLEYKEKYPDIIRLILQDQNVGPAKNWDDLIKAPKSKYIAYFEGDDYWIDPNKLQKQVFFLEENEEYGMIYSMALVYNNSKKKIIRKKLGGSISKKGLLFENPIPTLTTVFRRDLFLKFSFDVKSESENWGIGDYPIWLWFYYNSKIYFLPEVTGVYRLLNESASHTLCKNKIFQINFNRFEIANYYAAKYCDHEYYNEFLEYKNFYLFLYCIKHNLSEKSVYINNLKGLKNLSLKTKTLMFIFYHMKFEFLVSSFYQYCSFNKITKIFRKSLKVK